MKEALTKARDALKELVEKFDSEQFTSICELDPAKDAIAAAEEALAQPEQEPYVWELEEHMTPEQTLDWLAQQHFDQCCEERPIQDWIRKMKSQLPEPEQQEPVAWMRDDEMKAMVSDEKNAWISLDLLKLIEGYNKPLYTTPPQRTWVGLTDEERGKVYSDWRWSEGRTSNLALCKDIEALLKEKNT